MVTVQGYADIKIFRLVCLDMQAAFPKNWENSLA